MAFDYEKKYQELQSNPQFVEKVSKAKTAEDFIAVYKEFDVELTLDEANDIVKLIAAEVEAQGDEELTMEQMDQVSGGLVIAGVVIPAILWKTALALVATCGVVAGIKKLKKEFKKYF